MRTTNERGFQASEREGRERRVRGGEVWERRRKIEEQGGASEEKSASQPEAERATSGAG
jgi:hypothetical protein